MRVGHRPERSDIRHQRADHQHDLQHIVDARRRVQVAGGDGVEQAGQHDHQQEVEGDQHLALDVDAARPVTSSVPRKAIRTSANEGA